MSKTPEQPAREYGVATLHVGSKKWLEPTDYGTLEDARAEHEEIITGGNASWLQAARIVYRTPATAWTPLEEEQ